MFRITRYRPFGLSWLVWIAIAVSVVFGLILAFTRFGRHTYLIGSNIESARRAGIKVDRHVIKLYALNGALAGLAGMVSLTRFSTTTISGHAQDALQVITGVVLGGTSIFGGVGTVLGTSIGILIPAVLTNGFVVMNFQPFTQQIVIGGVLDRRRLPRPARSAAGASAAERPRRNAPPPTNHFTRLHAQGETTMLSRSKRYSLHRAGVLLSAAHCGDARRRSWSPAPAGFGAPPPIRAPPPIGHHADGTIGDSDDRRIGTTAARHGELGLPRRTCRSSTCPD